MRNDAALKNEPSLPDEASTSMTERRTQTDRRRRPTPMLSRYTFFGGRREGPRRDGERALYVDRYDSRLLVLLIGILSLSCLDALFTLHIVTSLGGSEANPIMDWFLQLGITPFLVSKICLTAAGVVVLCLHKNFTGVKAALFGLFGIYVLVSCYHLYLIHLK